jgi:hypothetical protein
VAELKAIAEVRRENLHEILQSRKIFGKVRRKLEKDGAQFFLQGPGVSQKFLPGFLRILQSFDVSYVAAGFDREEEPLGHLGSPAFKGSLGREMIKGVIDFYSVIALGIKRELIPAL